MIAAGALALLISTTSQQAQTLTICDPAPFLPPQAGEFDRKYVAEVVELGESIAGGGVNRFSRSVTLAPRHAMVGELPDQTIKDSYYFSSDHACANYAEPQPKLGDMWVVYLSGDHVIAAVSFFWERQHSWPERNWADR